ncbi:uncharacterized protein PITG_06064 [Phytophthora infestans T30-4]|uniref:Uncharacterized protein n=1 Tax=Phytophthora infestans (strain T30-4) TaxID=403677 RepID=D0N6B5_PHYIT|nr:uncharacterized protein PITG_06064 [Phytophthora infestans T30-4]EEY70606.1 conserved hypothetical protein [Phytophthora infestans T30-4]|eukprot:XP_002998260.1 conserved hypothetical protein [Phytophthora infestans T30-4]
MNESVPTSRRCDGIADLVNVVESDMAATSPTRVATMALGSYDHSDASDSARGPMKKKRIYKKRKSTHALRKEEKRVLQAEVAALQVKLKNLELQTLVRLEGSYAVTAADFVDEDELYPYRPQERIRSDTTSAVLVTSHADPVEADINGEHTLSKEEAL